ncbi:MAG: hypothetical protein ACYDBH_05530 [Acidobacteriaceae bacterium]
MERSRAKRTKENAGAATTIAPTMAGGDADGIDEPTVAISAGITATFHQGHGDEVTKHCVPEAAIAIIACNIMQ